MHVESGPAPVRSRPGPADPRPRWYRLSWALPWLLFQFFPVADLVTTDRPPAVRLAAGAGLVVFTAVYLDVFRRAFGGGGGGSGDRGPVLGRLAVVAGLGLVLAATMGPPWAGLLIYVSAAAAAALPQRWVWPAVLAAAAVCAAVVTLGGDGGPLILPVMCLLTAFALRGTRHLVSVNAELVEARDELARSAVAEERLRFARDLHDLLGHSLSLIALKSELAGRLAERDPARARAEMADVEAAARRALAEVREAVSGYRQVGLALALAEARAALSAAGVGLWAPSAVPDLPGPVDAVLGWVVREATTNTLRHSGARTLTVGLSRSGEDLVLTVTDDGRGPGGPPGAGLTGLAERLRGFGGRLEHGPAPGGGFRLAARLPAADRVGAR
ncbi:two-component system, NarL family, sensor histidine kinase DesK [Geodermatophilus pulveris]|uniref:Two-component system, NarL family, sensor histidine kinase DesK n=1 Tax=Geodermatophilus pulveris TaxID=1564159 RepID=A0A239IMS3_9ACTN|nr:histidine kinase [Geodermatophilus pulveris]SNS94887.1 two-component system, NarL family, sensor histidine kinase DesK [Geodermatophilus pulveris]